MTRQEQDILRKWKEAGLISDTRYWPFTKQNPKQMAKERKQKLADQINTAETALL